ncbi:hypothetical protein K493DRAFT_315157 [Basidiobolus meristosporus CBS 931.73]|uniref:REM-1 domain-containing protein n=1 Tax=Basidiobolus meristosporus CBS 931.73 TaxID=1314790 RepID=A0A1Y1YAZ6_9FUNG|nr:hypothetical protein K493DRAFT_315157 [Basidiobolus meristosporus CBS 931.73]|eukprot:ORX95112.1 hypothetical protein K493DRAFT_315157 [Basidiobolus meristosporus CBS 931.73]
MVVHKNSQQAGTSPALSRSEYVKPRSQDAQKSQPLNRDRPTNSEDICFTSYSSFTVKPKSINPLDLRDLQTYSTASSPEKKRFSSLTVSNLVNPMASLFHFDKASDEPKSPEDHTVGGARYDTLNTSENLPGRIDTSPSANQSLDAPRPSIDSLLEDFYVNSSRLEARDTTKNPQSPSNERTELLSSVLSDTRDFNALSWSEYLQLKQECLASNRAIDTLKARLHQETKIRDGASSMVNAQTDKKMVEQAQEQLLTSERKINQLSSELWRMTQKVNRLQRSFLEHIGAVLAESIHLGTGMPATPALTMESPSSLSQSITDMSLIDISDISSQLSSLSGKLDAFVKSHMSDRSLDRGQHDSVRLGIGYQNTMAAHSNANLLFSPMFEDTKQQPLSQTEHQQTKAIPEPTSPAERKAQGSDELQRLFDRVMSERVDGPPVSPTPTADAPLLCEDDKNLLIEKLQDQVEEYLSRITQLDAEKAALLSSLEHLYHQIPDLALSRENSVSSHESGFDMMKLGRRIDKVIQENHRLSDRVVNLQHKNQRLKKDQYETISRKSGLHGVYQTNAESDRWVHGA